MTSDDQPGDIRDIQRTWMARVPLAIIGCSDTAGRLR